MKTYNNTTTKQAKNQVKDLEVWGTSDMWKLISKASSVDEQWMKSTKAMEVEGLGCLIQVTTQQGDNIAEAVTFAIGCKIQEVLEDGKVVARKLVRI